LTAADHARSVYANAEAVLYLERALDAARSIDDLPVAEIVRVNEELGDVCDRMGKYRDAEVAYRRARRLLPTDPVAEARLMLKQAQQHARLNRFSQGQRWIRRALRLLEGLDGDAVVRQRARSLAAYAQFCVEQGRHRLALRWCERAIVEASALGDDEALALAQRTAGRAAGFLGDLAEASVRWKEALRLYERLGDFSGQGAMANNLGVLGYWKGEWHESRSFYRRSLELSERIGYEDGVAAAQYNLGHLLCDQGRTEEATPLLLASFRSSKAAGHRLAEATAQRELARIAALEGRHEAALEYLDAAHRTFEQVGSPVDDIDTSVTVAECRLLQGRPALALEAVDAALQQDHGLDGVSAQSPVLHRLRGYALFGLGMVEEAGIAFDHSLLAARSREMVYEVAATLHALVELADVGVSPPADVSVDDIRQESQMLLGRLGVVRLPDFVGDMSDPPAVSQIASSS
jgi:tetratricopeptide (TPR) repeat protein